MRRLTLRTTDALQADYEAADRAPSELLDRGSCPQLQEVHIGELQEVHMGEEMGYGSARNSVNALERRQQQQKKGW